MGGQGKLVFTWLGEPENITRGNLCQRRMRSSVKQRILFLENELSGLSWYLECLLLIFSWSKSKKKLTREIHKAINSNSKIHKHELSEEKMFYSIDSH